jgi:hypothetical protein
MKRICVFCGSSKGANKLYADAAKSLAVVLAQHKISLVYGGGNVGLMGILADEMLSRGGEVIGVIPESLVRWEVAHQHLTRQHIVQTMHERKAMMAELSDGFIALPGGMGTFDELCEILTWAQLGIHSKPVGLLNVAGYFNHWLAMCDHAAHEGFLRAEHRVLILEDSEAETLLKRLTEYRPAFKAKWPKWMDLDEV